MWHPVYHDRYVRDFAGAERFHAVRRAGVRVPSSVSHGAQPVVRSATSRAAAVAERYVRSLFRSIPSCTRSAGSGRIQNVPTGVSNVNRIVFMGGRYPYESTPAAVFVNPAGV